MLKKKVSLLLLVLCAFTVHADSTNSRPAPRVESNRTHHAVLATSNRIINFDKFAEKGYSFILTGLNPKLDIEFRVRKDQLVTKGRLYLDFTPSPALIPKESHLKVYINDRLLGIIDISKQDLGRAKQARLDINPLLIKNFNKITIRFVGQYDAICPTLDSPALWLDVNKKSKVTLLLQQLPLSNDLSFLPLPFFDRRDDTPAYLNFSLAVLQSEKQQLAASILSSWFGTLSKWRGLKVSVFDNTITKENTVVFITNDHRPKALAHYPKVSEPTIELIDNPSNQYSKILVISGRNDQDLISAVTGLSSAPQILRGKKVAIKKVMPLQERKPYDAPFWIKTNQPTTFDSLKTYSEQLQSEGIEPSSIFLNFKIPPDLYLKHRQGIALNLIYHYSEPSVPETSKLNISLNKSFVTSFILHGKNVSTGILPSISHFKNTTQTKQKLHIPVSSLASNNLLSFDFNYTFKSSGGNRDGSCISTSDTINHGVIDGRSSIDFSNYRHYIRMPNLRVFLFGGFPYSRMADLSQTMVYVPKKSSSSQLEILLNLMGRIGAETGLPVFRLMITHEWSELKEKDVDIIAIGDLPKHFSDDTSLSVYLTKQQTWLHTPMREPLSPQAPTSQSDRSPYSQTTISAKGGMAAISQVQSPYFKGRSLVAILASNPHGFELVNQMLLNPKRLNEVHGSVSLIRASGVSSIEVGDIYYVGHLPFITKLWYSLQNYPVILGLCALIGAILAGWLLKQFFLIISGRRLNPHHSARLDE